MHTGILLGYMYYSSNNHWPLHNDPIVDPTVYPTVDVSNFYQHQSQYPAIMDHSAIEK